MMKEELCEEEDDDEGKDVGDGRSNHFFLMEWRVKAVLIVLGNEEWNSKGVPSLLITNQVIVRLAYFF